MYCNSKEISNNLKTLCRPENVYELRAINSKGFIEHGFFNDLDKMALAASVLSAEGCKAVYYTLNPVPSTYLAVANNRIVSGKKDDGAKDKDILRRTSFMIDCDPVRIPKTIMATTTEKAVSIEVIGKVRTYLREQGWPAPFMGDSGNGGHLVYGLDLPNNKESDELIAAVLKSLAARFDIPGKATIDQTVKNAARINKVYGTMVRKGDELPDRPYRLSAAMHNPERLDAVPVELLRKVADDLTAPQSPPTSSPLHEARPGSFDVESFCDRHGIEYEPPTLYRGGDKWILPVCPFDPSHNNRAAAMYRTDKGIYAFKCLHDSCREKKLRDLVALKGEPWPFEYPEYLTYDPEDFYEAPEPALSSPPGAHEAKQEATKKPVRIRSYRVSEILRMPPPEWVIEEHIPRGAFCSLFGASGSFKSFIALDWCLSIATGRKYLDKWQVKPGRIAYVASEGGLFNFSKRLQAWCKDKDVSPAELESRLLAFNANLDLQSRETAAAFMLECTRVYNAAPEIIVFDTLSRNFGSGDPNDNKDMQTWCGVIDYIRKDLCHEQTTVIVVHHTGWSDQTRERSASNLRDSVEVSIRIEREDNSPSAVISCRKQKDAPEFPAYVVTGENIWLTDDPLDALTEASLVFKYDGEASEMNAAQREEKRQKRDAKRMAEFLKTLLGMCATRAQLVATTKMHKGTVSKYVKEALAGNFVFERGNFVCLNDNGVNLINRFRVAQVAQSCATRAQLPG